MLHTVCVLVSTFAIFFLTVVPPLFSLPPETSRPVTLILNDWSSQIVMSKITGHIFKEMGYTVHYQTSTIEKQWGGLARGKYHVQVEVWEGTMKDMFERMVTNGSVSDAGTHDAMCREEWWYPLYIEELCPGLPDWQALNRCYKLFVTPETYPKGRYLTGPWEKPDRIRVTALNMNFHVISVDHGDKLRTELQHAVANKLPIVMFNWTPNWVEAKYDGKFVEFPEWTPDCEKDQSWGINPELRFDCGNPRSAWLKKAAWSGMETTWPCAYKALNMINFSNAMISELSLLVDYEKLTYDDAALKWIKDNESLWRSWIPETCEKNR